VKLAGSSIAPGLAMGTVSLVGDFFEHRRPAQPAVDLDSESEWARVQGAVAATRQDIAEAVVRLEREVSSEVADVFRAHQMMLDGLLASGQITAQLREPGVDASRAVRISAGGCFAIWKATTLTSWRGCPKVRSSSPGASCLRT
jgi:phosphoenolpyruvate-protein kinase (PTS system EI component)